MDYYIKLYSTVEDFACYDDGNWAVLYRPWKDIREA